MTLKAAADIAIVAAVLAAIFGFIASAMP